MNYYNPSTKERISHKQLCDKFNASIPSTLEEYKGWYKLTYANRPTTASYQTVKQNNDPEYIDGKWTITYSVEEIAIDTIRNKKTYALNTEFNKINKKTTVKSSLGFTIDAGETANRDITGLITVMENTGLTSVQFCDANNNFHTVTLEDCKTMLLEIIQNGQALYQQKWAYRDAIASIEDVVELDALTISFEPLDFTTVESEEVEEVEE